MADTILTKHCRQCNTTKLLTEFHVRRDGNTPRYRPECKSCRNKDDNERYYEKYRDDPERQERARQLGRKHYALKREFYSERNKRNDRTTRELAIGHYGGECACCKENRYEFLALDHTDGGGNQHRKTLGSGGGMHRWLVRNNFPDGFRVLCHNCNMAIGFYGFCPHQRE
jgi:hypothetical protein